MQETMERTWLIVAMSISPLFVYYILKKIRKVVIQWALKHAYKDNRHALLALKLLGGKNPPLDEFQSLLPSLPVPKLSSTLKQWLESVRPLVSEEAFRRAEEAAKEFESSKEGKDLQVQLVKRSKQCSNWLEDWWVQFAYLRQRVSLMTYVNYFCTDSSDFIFREPYTSDPIRRVVDLIESALDFKHRVDHNTLRPLRIKNVLPVCMKGMNKVFGTTRSPGDDCDELKTHIVPEDGDAHVLLMVGSSMFKLPVQVGGKRVSNSSIEQAIREATRAADSQGKSEWGEGRHAQPHVSQLTGLSRNKWASMYREMVNSHEANKEGIRTIEEALFAVSLLEDSVDSGDLHQYVNICLHNRGRQIWFDKCFTILAFKDGRVGWHYEHTYADAPVPGLMCEHAMVNGNPSSEDIRCYPRPLLAFSDAPVSASPIRWQCDALPGMKQWLREAEEETRSLLSDFDIRPFYWRNFGADVIKKCSMSPDAFCQAVVSTRYWGRAVLTYESASLRVFEGGRTDTIRSATSEVCEFAREFVKEKRILALINGMPLPKLFQEEAYNLEFQLATSQSPIVQEHEKVPVELMTLGGGFGPITSPGLGISYHILPDRLYFYVSVRSKDAEEDSKRCVEYIQQALEDLKGLLLRCPPEKKKS
ncbi:hypothetical protein GUITHDRAFT_115656 [Guillardia theta CCMP2712]|uniref:Choline/carnitine acyltransferase domain-containing protein n=1 Tax=Guillardia theta (strain CCMP2712) TaxID=905079 RepID=L1IPS6_GUITC|nr:hypothetical protein GUITHDRAFT_115656 [Guillardia theta CCMP2712]EKX38102.1 hypothetical protein GUITHDRAFT_115656 [Guillardia theta CCMP2712]|eukprot:XP_005825082.1 hypothetical protein GUITHDRAFT_115656 [Guillardia theta CCMP2712]